MKFVIIKKGFKVGKCIINLNDIKMLNTMISNEHAVIIHANGYESVICTSQKNQDFIDFLINGNTIFWFHSTDYIEEEID